MPKILLEELEIFVAVAHSGNFSKAAESLDITASVASKTVKKLERKLETTLFNRTTRKVFLTQEGEWLVVHANEMLAQARSVEDHFSHGNNTPSGTLKIDAPTPFAIHAIAPLIKGFNQRYPNITVLLQSTESNIDLIDRKVDVAIRIGPLNDSTMKAKKLGECFRHLYASPQYLKRQGTPKKPTDLANHACLGFIKPNKLNTWPITNEENNSLPITPALFADNGETLKQLALKNCGIACLSSFTAKEEISTGRLVEVLEADIVQTPIPVYAVFYSDNEMNNRLRCFLDYISTHIELH